MRKTVIAFALLFVSCAHVVPATEPAVIHDRLYCGLKTRAGVLIAPAELEAFLDDVVEAQFPQGFTVFRAQGRWRGGQEEVMVIEIVHPMDARLDAAVASIAEEYRRRFDQEAVLRLSVPARMDFVDGVD